MKKALIAVLVLGLLGTGAYGVYHHFFKDIQMDAGRVSSDDENAVYVDAVFSITGYGSGNGLIQRFAGEIEPQATLEIKLEGDKTVEECFVKEGDIVKEGQRLFIYDIRESEDNLMQAEIDLERLESDIEVSKRQIEQLEKEKKNAEDEDERLSIETDIMSLQTSIKRSEYDIKSKNLEMESLKESIASATVTADMAGKVQKISDTDNADSYSYSDSSVYITILAEGDYRVKGSVNEQAVNLGMVYSGMPVIVYSRVDDSLMWKGTVTEVDTSSSEDDESDNMYYYYGSGSGESSSYTFYVELEGSEGLILGQHVYMEEDRGQDLQKDGMWLEEYYLSEEDGTYFVWAANEKNVLVKQEVTLGEYDAELMKYEILSGLAAEDYIAYPQDSVFEGCPVIYNDFGSEADVMFGDEYFEEEYDDLYFEDDEYWDDEVYFEDDEYSDDEVYFEDDEYSEDGEYFEDDEYSEDGEYFEDDEYSEYEENFDEEADMGAALFSMDGDIEYDAPDANVEMGAPLSDVDALVEAVMN